MLQKYNIVDNMLDTHTHPNSTNTKTLESVAPLIACLLLCPLVFSPTSLPLLRYPALSSVIHLCPSFSTSLPLYLTHLFLLYLCWKAVSQERWWRDHSSLLSSSSLLPLFPPHSSPSSLVSPFSSSQCPPCVSAGPESIEEGS